jgi:superoxide dismutase, Cu-Zn family
MLEVFMLKRQLQLFSVGLISLGMHGAFAEDVSTHLDTAKSVLHPTKGNNVTGTVTFTTVEDGVRVIADVQGLTPGDHGFHIHEFGDCSAPDASSAGAHFNPTKKSHGSPENSNRHVGDLGNITADSSGRAHYDRVDHVIDLNGDDHIVGRSVVIHAQADDFVTQPSGNSGARVACGVIEAE